MDEELTLELENEDSILDSVTEESTTDNGSQITVVVNNPTNNKSSDDEPVHVILDNEEYQLKSVNTEVMVKSPSNTTGLKSVVLSVIGDYETTVTDYTYQSYSGSTQHSINVEPDYAWICTAAIFLVCLYSMFRLYGLLFGRGRR